LDYIKTIFALSINKLLSSGLFMLPQQLDMLRLAALHVWIKE